MKTANMLLLSCFVSVLYTAESTQAEIEPPPLDETRSGTSLSAALKVLKGESDRIVGDVVLLDDNTLVELDAPFGRHEAFIFFVHVPCKEAVPLLISALDGYTKLKEKEGKEMVICTWAHLHTALMAQTGENFAFDQSAWRAWWEAKGKDQPNAFYESSIQKFKKANRVAGGN